MASLRGQLLVAGPTLVDPNFHRTVVLVCEHDEEGAMGLVLNRPSPIRAEQAIPELKDALATDDSLWLGGPVQTTSVVVLADFVDDGEEEGMQVAGQIGLVLPDSDLDAVAATVNRARAFLGYAGWGGGQLDGELERDDWIVTEFEPGDAFTDDPEALWKRVLNRKGGPYAFLATMPPDPSLN
ncbi:MAG TPA: YqgE/AlgH family protein [Solirubrobacteraceae bacterium]|nr:YqgE/AlgH family protein [Solirubrobacteraceae bacterium]